MHVGGASANAVVRAALPSAAGHGVAPSIASPGGGAVTAGVETVVVSSTWWSSVAASVVVARR